MRETLGERLGDLFDERLVDVQRHRVRVGGRVNRLLSAQAGEQGRLVLVGDVEPGTPLPGT
jgi:hypothetical protein